MSDKKKGHFAEKHADKKKNPEAVEKLRRLGGDSHITCAAAHKAAAALNMLPEEIGTQIDLLEFRITQCQVGLFGYPDTKKQLDENIVIEPDLEKKLDETAVQGRISCLDCWNIARLAKASRLDVGSACEKKQIRIKPCQLGAF